MRTDLFVHEVGYTNMCSAIVDGDAKIDVRTRSVRNRLRRVGIIDTEDGSTSTRDTDDEVDERCRDDEADAQ